MTKTNSPEYALMKNSKKYTINQMISFKLLESGRQSWSRFLNLDL